MSVKELLVNKTADERTEIKTKAIYDEVQKVSAVKQWSFKDTHGRTVKIEEYGIGELGNNTVVPSTQKISPIWFKISVDGKYLNGDGWYGFVNPPTMVPDGTKSLVVDDITKIACYKDNFKENVLEAIKTVILQTIGGV